MKVKLETNSGVRLFDMKPGTAFESTATGLIYIATDACKPEFRGCVNLESGELRWLYDAMHKPLDLMVVPAKGGS